MKRTTKIQEPLLFPKDTRLWAFIFCVGEDKAIAVSTVPIEMGNIPSVSFAQWGVGCAEYRYGYFIDFSKIQPGQKVVCPQCGSDVDFRLIPSTEKPKMV